jgi:hypothetical protein
MQSKKLFFSLGIVAATALMAVTVNSAYAKTAASQNKNMGQPPEGGAQGMPTDLGANGERPTSTPPIGQGRNKSTSTPPINGDRKGGATSTQEFNKGIAGEVTAIDGTTITLKQGQDEIVYTVDASSASIKQRVGSTTSDLTISDLASGDFIAVQGSVSSTNITAESITKISNFGGQDADGKFDNNQSLENGNASSSPNYNFFQKIFSGIFKPIRNFFGKIFNK